MAKIGIEGEPDPALAQILILGKFPPKQISVHYSSVPFIPSDQQRPLIENRWGEAWFNGPLSRLSKAAIVNGSLKLSMQPTDFKTYVGTRADKDLRRFGVKSIASPLSVSLAIRGSDGAFVIAKKLHGDREGALDAPGGYVVPRKVEVSEGERKEQRSDVLLPSVALWLEKMVERHNKAARPFERFLSVLHRKDAIRAAYREFREETGCAKDTVLSMMAIGLQFEHKNLNHPVLSFLCHSRLTSEEIVDASRKANREVQLLRSWEPLRTLKGYEADGMKIEPDGQLTYALAWLHVSAERKSEVTPLSEVVCTQTLEEAMLSDYQATFGDKPPASPLP